MERTLWIGLWGLLLSSSIVNGVPYSKYGRTCKDIGCRPTEECVMAHDECSTYDRTNCGQYPTCRRKTDSGGSSCTSIFCPTGQYCKTVDGRATCINTNSNLAPAARRPVGGRRPSGKPKPVVPTPPPRSSSFGYGGRYPSSFGNSIASNGGTRDSIWSYGGGDRTGSRSGSRRQSPSRNNNEDEGDSKDLTRRQSAGGSSSYPGGSGYPSSNRETPVPSAPVESSAGGNPLQSGKPSSAGGSGYPSYPSSGSSGYPSYPASGGSGYPSYPTSGSSGYPSYPTSGSSGYPSYPSSGRSGYPSYSSSGSSEYPSYPAGSGYSSGSPGYAGGSGYPSDSARRTSATNVNAQYPNAGQYPQGGYGQGYPQGGYGQGYPSQGYPGQGQYGNPGGYQGQYPQGGYPQNGQYPQQNKPSFGDQLKTFAENLAKKVLAQAIIDKVSGKS